ncbi:glycosyltransferase family 2 protein [Thermoanaerobacter brockii subsp. lactiethylicus]
MKKEVSILMPVLNEMGFIEQVLNDIEQQDYPLELVEVLIIDGGSEDGTKEWILKNMNKYKFNIKLLDNQNKYQSFALNIGLKNAQGDFIIRMDAHSRYERRYIYKLINHLKNNDDICNIGGPQIATGYDFWSDVISKAISSPIGVGGARFRYTSRLIESDTVYLGAWRKKDLIEIGGWSEEWFVNEDTELNLRLKRFKKGKLITDPDIKVYYYPRNSLKKLAVQYYKFGFWRIKTFNVYPESMRMSHLLAIVGVPIIFLSFITWIINNIPTFSTIFPQVGLIFWLYLLVVFIYSIYVGFKDFNLNPAKIMGLFVAIMIIHFSWVLGAMKGIKNFGFPLKAVYNVFNKILKGVI